MSIQRPCAPCTIFTAAYSIYLVRESQDNFFESFYSNKIEMATSSSNYLGKISVFSADNHISTVTATRTCGP